MRLSRRTKGRAPSAEARQVGAQRIHITVDCHVTLPFVAQDISELSRRIKTVVEQIPGVAWINPNEVWVRFDQPIYGS